ELLEGLKFKVNGSDGAIKTSDPALAEFSGKELLIRTLKHQELIYSNLILKYEDELEFSFVSADVPLMTSGSSFENRKT